MNIYAVYFLPEGYGSHAAYFLCVYLVAVMSHVVVVVQAITIIKLFIKHNRNLIIMDNNQRTTKDILNVNKADTDITIKGRTVVAWEEEWAWEEREWAWQLPVAWLVG